VSKNNKSAKVSPDLDTPTDLPQAAVDKISASLNVLLADAFALYMKTKNFHWHVSGRHFRDYHLMLDEQSDAIFATTDQIAERVRKLGGTTLRSIGQVAKLQTIQDNNEDYVPPSEMLRELMEDNKHMAAAMRKAHKLCDDHEDSGTATARSLHRRDRAPHLVSVRGQPAGRRQRSVSAGGASQASAGGSVSARPVGLAGLRAAAPGILRKLPSPPGGLCDRLAMQLRAEAFAEASLVRRGAGRCLSLSR
jgi:starvation-inducible DNA-binding protein